MRVYVGQTRSVELMRRLWLLGIGECTARGELPPRRHPWFYDNGAYGDWKANRPFDSEQFLRDMDGIYLSIDRPDFIVLPDIVAGGAQSLAFSKSWVHRIRGLAPLYLAVQDGMKAADIEGLRDVAGIFIGGTKTWKERTGATWVDAAHGLGLRCHIGRAGGVRRVRLGMRAGADSIDSSLPLWSEDNLRRFLAALDPAQRELQMDSENDCAEVA